MTLGRAVTLALALATTVALVGAACGADSSSTSAGGPSADEGRTYETAGGQQIPIVNSSPESLQLLDWAFSRFPEAGLTEPVVSRLHFGPEAVGCIASAGWTRQTNGVEIAICFSEERICSLEVGLRLTTPAKLCALHELAHVWLMQNLSPETEAAFLDHADLDAWITTDETPWHQRGVEYGAETLAWGLMDTRLDLVRFESPDCHQLEAGFGLLTGSTPLVGCEADL